MLYTADNDACNCIEVWLQQACFVAYNNVLLQLCVLGMGKRRARCHTHFNPAAFASWHVGLQYSCDSRDQWLECARAAFASMDSAEKGHITSSQLVSMLSTKLPAEEVEHAVEDALMEAGCGGESVMLLRFMWVYVQFIRCMPLHKSKQSQRLPMFTATCCDSCFGCCIMCLSVSVAVISSVCL